MTFKKASKILFFIVLLTFYLNIGWGLGYYFHTYVFNTDYRTASLFAQALGGHCLLMSFKGLEDLWRDGVVFSFIWPVYLVMSLVSWIIHLIWWVLLGIWYLLVVILWLVFAGGLFKLASGIP